MARACKIPTDPEVYANLIEYLARGLPCSLIAGSLGINEKTVAGWKLRKAFKKDLDLKKTEILLEEARKVQGLTLLERHPDTRKDFAPPRQDTNLTGQLDIHANLSTEELLAIATGGRVPSGDKSGQD